MTRHVHFIGIGGSGLSAMAVVLKERGEIVSGSDRQASSITRDLQEAGMTVMIGHRPENVLGADLVIRSSAVREDHIEVRAAIDAGIPVYKRADFLSQLTSGQHTIAIAGTHGKTTTTSLTAWLLSASGYDPSYVIGGSSINLKANAHAGKGMYFVIEADEYDRMFLGLEPWIAVVTNVEHDHPDCYPTPADFQLAFEEFVNRIPQGGFLIAGWDNPGSRRLLISQKSREVRSLSFSLQDTRADYFAVNPQPNSSGGYSFGLAKNGAVILERIRLQVPGLHNVSNALAALGVIDSLEIQLGRVLEACEEFRGTGRRFEIRGESRGITVIDDYAHHPTEIRATLAAARARYPGQRIWAVWQPHTFSRTRILLDDFAKAFADADRVIVTEIFAAREEPPTDGFSGSAVAERLARSTGDRPEQVVFQPEYSAASEFLLKEVIPGDIVLVLSAGDADQISAAFVDALHQGEGL